MPARAPLSQIEINQALRNRLITFGDLEDFKTELLSELKILLLAHSHQPSKKWLKAYEVREMLQISNGKLQMLRQNGTIPYTKIGALTYYNIEDIEKMMKTNNMDSRPKP